MAVQLKKQIRPSEYDVAEDDSVYDTRSHTSVRRYQPPKQKDTEDDLPAQPVIARRRTVAPRFNEGGLNTGNGIASKAATPPIAKVWRASGQRRFPLIALFLGMVLAVVLAIGVSAFASWWQVHENDMLYGRPRTFQLDAVVGHNDSPANPTHFIIINLNRHVEIIELPGGDGAHARIYMGPTLFGDGQDLTPVTAEARDVNGDGRPDLILHIQDQTIVYINDGSMFRPMQPGDHVTL